MPGIELSKNGTPYVQGVDSSGSTDRGANPLKTGGKYNATLPTLADLAVVEFQVDSSGRLVLVGSDRVNQEQRVAIINRQIATWADSQPINNQVANYTSSWIDLAPYAGAHICLFLDHGDATGYGTIIMQGSPDNGTNILPDALLTFTTTPGAATLYGTTFEVTHNNTPRYVRFAYTLGATICAADVFVIQKTSY